MGELDAWRTWWVKRRWYERNRRLRRRWRINRHMARGRCVHPLPDRGRGARGARLRAGWRSASATLLEPGCWLTLGPEAEIGIGQGCFLNRGTMLAAVERIEIGDHVMFANGCFVGDSDHRYDDPEMPITWQGFEPRGAGADRLNVWFGVNCVVTGGVEIGDRAVIGANSVVTRDIPAGHDRRRRAGEGDPRDRVQVARRADSGSAAMRRLATHPAPRSRWRPPAAAIPTSARR